MNTDSILYKDKDEKIIAHTTTSKKVTDEFLKTHIILLAILLAVPAGITYIGLISTNIDVSVVLFIQTYLVLAVILVLPYLPFFIIPLQDKTVHYYVTNLRFIAYTKKRCQYTTIEEISKVKTNETIFEERKNKYSLYEVHFYEKYEGKYFKKLSFVDLDEKDELMDVILSLKDFET